MSEDLFDQAAGLRRWAEQQRAPAPQEPPPSTAPDRTLLVFGPAHLEPRARAVLERWHRQGQKWIGHPQRWQVRAVQAPGDPRWRTQRWGLWINSDLDAFQTAFSALRQWQAQGGSDCILALHDGFASADGLLGNLCAAARAYLGIRLLLVDEWRA